MPPLEVTITEITQEELVLRGDPSPKVCAGECVCRVCVERWTSVCPFLHGSMEREEQAEKALESNLLGQNKLKEPLPTSSGLWLPKSGEES